MVSLCRLNPNPNPMRYGVTVQAYELRLMQVIAPGIRYSNAPDFTDINHEQVYPTMLSREIEFDVAWTWTE